MAQEVIQLGELTLEGEKHERDPLITTWLRSGQGSQFASVRLTEAEWRSLQALAAAGERVTLLEKLLERACSSLDVEGLEQTADEIRKEARGG